MSERTRNILYGALMLILVATLAMMISTEPAESDRVQEIGALIKCPVCQGESIADSPAQLARDMMALVEVRVGEGATDEQIIDELLASYSGAVLLDPPASGRTLALWLAPGIALIAGLATIAWWRRHPGGDVRPRQRSEDRSRRRLVTGGLVLAGAFATVVVVAANFLQDREGPASGVAAVDTQDLSEVSNETLEAVIATNADNPQIDGMRLALAERYFDSGDYRSAFPHYLAIADAPSATDAQATTALIRLGWMAYDGNGEVETAISLLDQALDIAPTSQVALYLKGRVLWCGAGEASEAIVLFEGLLVDPDLPEESRGQIQEDMRRASQGQGCV